MKRIREEESIASYSPPIVICAYPPAFDVTITEGGPCQNCYDVWYGKARMVWLPNCEKILKICLFVSTESMNVRDRQTPHDGTGHAYAQYRTAETLQEMLTS